jgi:hypothetical protein
LLIGQAYDEFCRLLVEKRAPDPEEFCARFPGIQSSLHRLVFTHFLVDQLGEPLPVGVRRRPTDLMSNGGIVKNS